MIVQLLVLALLALGPIAALAWYLGRGGSSGRRARSASGHHAVDPGANDGPDSAGDVIDEREEGSGSLLDSAFEAFAGDGGDGGDGGFDGGGE